MSLEIALLFFGFFLLIKGADFLVEGASSLALTFNISQIVIGLTIVAFGTSAPELIVNVFASIKGSSELTIGNVVGSNIINILVILGISAIITPLHTQKNTVWREIPFSLLAVIAILIIVNDSFFNAGNDMVSIGDGALLLLFFIIFLSYVYAISKNDSILTEDIKTLPVKKSIIFVLIGISGLFIGGKLIVDSAIEIARIFSISEAIIGFTIVAIGTSLPELATSVIAAKKGNSDIAIGNVVGSNIFNIFLILGVSALINPIEFNANLNIDLIVLLIVTLILFFTMFTGKKRVLERWEGIILVIGYVLYLIRFIVLPS